MRGTKVLIVDDEVGIRQSLRGVLGDEGYECTAVESGEPVLPNGRENYEAVLLDIWLPGMDGLAALKLIQEMPVARVPGSRHDLRPRQY